MTDPKAAPASSPKLVQDIMTADVKCVTGDMTVKDAIRLLMNHEISGAPYVDGMHTMISVVTQGDLMRLAATKGIDKTIATCVKELPGTGKIATLSRKETVTAAYKKFLATNLHRLIVTDDSGRIQGIVSRSDILKHLVVDGTPAK